MKDPPNVLLRWIKETHRAKTDKTKCTPRKSFFNVETKTFQN